MKDIGEILGNERVVAGLKREIELGKVFDAYLLSGPKGIGKMALARAMALELRKMEKDLEGQDWKTRMEAGADLDLLVMEGAEGEKMKIEEVREMIGKLQTRGMLARRIVIMRDIERMTVEAANAFLKILEEPPEGVVFLMTCGSTDDVLETILSRVRVVKMYRQRDELVRTVLEGMDEEKREKLVMMAQGRVGLAMRLQEEGELLKKYDLIWEGARKAVSGGSMVEAFQFIGKLAEDRKDLEICLEMMEVMCREKLLESDAGIKGVEEVVRAKELLRTNANSKLLMENLILQLC